MIDVVSARICDLLATLPGVQRTFWQLPGKLNAADLPAVLVTPGAAEYQIVARDVVQERREYGLLLYVLPLTAGVFGAGHNRSLPLIEPVRRLFATHAQLDGMEDVAEAAVTRDSGVAVMLYDQLQYVGVEFVLTAVLLHGDVFGA